MSTNESVELTMTSSKESDKTLGKGDFISDLALRTASDNHKKYGNMKVVLETESILITLGPDYPCFVLSFLCFGVADYFLISLVNSSFENFVIKIVNLAIVVLQLLSYLSIAVSNPGIALPQNMPSEQTLQSEEEPGRVRFCLKCKLRMVSKMYHCKSCDVCIKDYDHHCPWVSKCIGGGNLKRFYFFTTITPLYIMYFVVMLMIGLAVSAEGKKAA